jgi:hypothetical protein
MHERSPQDRDNQNNGKRAATAGWVPNDIESTSGCAATVIGASSVFASCSSAFRVHFWEGTSMEYMDWE